MESDNRKAIDEPQEQQAEQPNPNPAPESLSAPDVNFTNRVTGVIHITGEEPIT
jgi:hypothetical protein